MEGIKGQVKNGISYGNYDIYSSGRPLWKAEGTPDKWMATAQIIRWIGNHAPPVWILEWSPPKYPVFDTEDDAQKYGEDAAIKLISAGLCPF